jgi:exodeoxyribonuclease V gamma subunit
MSFTIYISNKIEALADAMSKKVAAQKGSPFIPTHLVTQTKGMDNWLKFNLANKLGITANLSFKTPADLIFEVYKLLGGSYGEKINRQQLDLLIYAVLGQEGFITKFPIQAKYFYSEGKRDELKQWEFAAKIADLLDQYQIYRSPLIENWNTTPLKDLPPDEQWQAFIWQNLKQKTDNAVIDITETAAYIINTLKEPAQQEKLRKLMPEVYLFGLSIITPFHLSLFYVLGQYINLDWYISNPAPEYYWFEDEKEENVFLKKMKGKQIAHLNIGNELLTSWGKVIQNTFRMIFQTEEFINAIEDIKPTEPGQKTLLEQIQRDIYRNAIEASPLSEEQISDGSILITANYSKRREVETLYNYIVDIISNKKINNLSDRDIIVMASDINAYAPFIRAVMDNAPYKFAYTIADESLTNGDNIISALLAILEFNGAKFSAEKLLQLLTFKSIRDRFDIYNIDLIRQAVSIANIKYGTDNDYNNSIDDTYLVSFHYGLQKIMYGMCFADSTYCQTDKELYTVEISDAVADMQQLTCFSAFVAAMVKHVEKRKSPKTLDEWESFVNETLADLIYIDELENEEQYRALHKKIVHPDEIKLLLQNETIGYDVYSRKLINTLNNESNQAKFLTKGITFCSPLPFRNIPFKVVAMLGLNYDAFPRKEQKVDFDLIAKTPKIGDRNIKNNDKHLFLESLLSAQDALYLSFCGKSAKDNKALPPSILIDELLDYIQAANKNIDARSLIVQHHPLHSYSNQYNKKENNLLPNYLIDQTKNWPIAPPNLEDIEANNDKTEFTLNEVASYFYNAVKYYYTQVLQVHFEREENEIEEEELFSLDNLRLWQLNDARLKAHLSENEEEHAKHIYLTGALPLKNVATSYIQAADKSISPIVEKFKADYPDSQAKNLEINYEYKGCTFSGRLKNLFENRLLYLHSGALEKILVHANIEYLFALQTKADIQPSIIYQRDNKTELESNATIRSSGRLHQLLDTFLEHRKELSLYSANTHAEKMEEKNFLTKLEEQIKKKTDYDPYIAHAYETADIKEQQKYFTTLNPIIKEILLNYANK